MLKENLKKIKEEWKNDYFLSLGIYQHLVECQQKFEMWKNHAISNLPKDKLKEELDKELADLKILLDLYCKEDMVTRRINKFLENIKNDKHNIKPQRS